MTKLRKNLESELSAVMQTLTNQNQKMEDICGALVDLGMQYSARLKSEDQSRGAPLSRWSRHKDESADERRIALTVMNGVEVSTVAVMDEQNKKVAYYETSVFNGIGSFFDYQSRYQGRDDAEREHAQVCRALIEFRSRPR